MAHRLKTGDLVRVIAGKHKGTTGKIMGFSAHGALVEGIGLGHRHVKPNQLNPRGGKKDIHVAMPLHKLALVVDEKSGKTSRIGYTANADGLKVRVARQLKNKEIK